MRKVCHSCTKAYSRLKNYRLRCAPAKNYKTICSKPVLSYPISSKQSNTSTQLRDYADSVSIPSRWAILYSRNSLKLTSSVLFMLTVVVRRIIKLWERTMFKFKYNVDLWKQFLDFCIKNQSKKQFYRALSSAIRFVPFSEDLWLIGINY